MKNLGTAEYVEDLIVHAGVVDCGRFLFNRLSNLFL